MSNSIKTFKYQVGDLVQAEFRMFANEVAPPLELGMVSERYAAMPPEFPHNNYVVMFDRKGSPEREVRECDMRPV